MCFRGEILSYCTAEEIEELFGASIETFVVELSKWPLVKQNEVSEYIGLASFPHLQSDRQKIK